MRKKYYEDDRSIEEDHRYSYYTDQYRKMNLQQFNVNVQNDLQKLKRKAENYKYESPCRKEIDTTIHRLKIFIYFMGFNNRPSDLGDIAFVSDKSVRLDIYKNSNITPPSITDDICEEDEFYALGLKNYKQNQDRNHVIDKANFTEEEHERYKFLCLDSKWSNAEDVERDAFDTVISARENAK